MARFHDTDWPDRPGLLAGLSDKRLSLLGKRLIYTEAPHIMSAQARNNYDVAVARRLMAEEGTVPWLTLPKAIADTDDLLAVASGEEAALLSELREYLGQWADNSSVLSA